MIPQTRWWMWVPPTSTFPGHQLTWARIMWALVRMKPNVSRNEDEEEELRLLAGVDDGVVGTMLAEAGRAPAAIGAGDHGTRTTLPTLRRSAMKRCASARPLEREGLGDDRLDPPFGEAGDERLDRPGRGCPRGPTTGAC